MLHHSGQIEDGCILSLTAISSASSTVSPFALHRPKILGMQFKRLAEPRGRGELLRAAAFTAHPAVADLRVEPLPSAGVRTDGGPHLLAPLAHSDWRFRSSYAARTAPCTGDTPTCQPWCVPVASRIESSGSRDACGYSQDLLEARSNPLPNSRRHDGSEAVDLVTGASAEGDADDFGFAAGAASSR